jgi:sensor histidine kinase regulating citrate/malate metabolism
MEQDLALITVQMIMTNFGGEILEPQSTNQGATFMIMLPQYTETS